METCRGRVALVALMLATALALARCSGSSGVSQAPGSPDAKAEAPAAPAGQATPAAEARIEPSSRTPAVDGSFAPERATGAVKGVPAPTNTAPIVAVANYFTELPGIDVASLRSSQKEKFLQRVNSELCTCGCRNDTLARCYVNDPRCPVVKGMVQKVYEESKAGR